MRLLYFAWLREKTGIAEEEVDLPSDLATIGDVLRWQKTRGEAFAAAFERDHVIRAAIDQTHARNNTAIAGAREIAFFPPVTGG